MDIALYLFFFGIILAAGLIGFTFLSLAIYKHQVRHSKLHTR